MIGIEFTCGVCGNVSKITEDDIADKKIVPVCDPCYENFLAEKSKIVTATEKKLTGLYKKYGIPVDTFNAAEEFAGLG